MQDYAAKPPLYFENVRSEIAPLLPSPCERVLDVGCGAGATLQWLKQSGLAGLGLIGFAHLGRAADQCDVKQRSFWDSQWPVATCDGKIDATEYDKCLTTISSASCGSAVDLANVVLVKCSSGTVCSAGPK